MGRVRAYAGPMLRRVFPALMALSLLAPAAAQRLPQLDGRPLWHGPLREAPAEVRRAIEQHREVRRARLRPPTADTGEWAREVMQPWLSRTRGAIQEIERTLGAADVPPSWRLVGAILTADLHEHLGLELLTMPPPPPLAGDAEMTAMYTRTLRETVDPILQLAVAGFEVCEPIAAATPAPFDTWAMRCRERAASLRARLAVPAPEAPVITPLRGAEGLPSVCSPPARRHSDEGPAPDLSAPLRVVVVPVSSRWSTRDAERIAQEVERTLTRRGLELVPSAEARRARALVAQRRWRRAGPVCEVPPPIAVLLADDHPNLVYAVVTDSCSISGCSLEVHFRRPNRELTPGDTSLPPELHASFERQIPRTADWIAAARRLDVPVMTFGVLGLLAGAGGGSFADVFVPRFHVAMPDGDPIFAPSARIYGRERALRECFRGEGVVAFRFDLEVNERGAVTRTNVDIVEGTLSGSERAITNVRSCFERVMGETTFGCPSGESTHVEGHVCVDGTREHGALGMRRAP